jgi:hypothetical protein
MRKIALLGASALVLALGLAGASAEQFNPVTGYHGSAIGSAYGASTSEGRAAATEGWAPSSSVLEQFHEGK